MIAQVRVSTPQWHRRYWPLLNSYIAFSIICKERMPSSPPWQHYLILLEPWIVRRELFFWSWRLEWRRPPMGIPVIASIICDILFQDLSFPQSDNNTTCDDSLYSLADIWLSPLILEMLLQFLKSKPECLDWNNTDQEQPKHYLLTARAWPL